ncbi:MAG: N-acetyltransferase [Bacteroidales bacterium]|nr:N-acetyltransferase [Bacteroidales bacterium]
MIHPLSDCLNAHIHESTNIWQFTVVLPGAVIGRNCNICSHCFIENEVSIGDNVTIKAGVKIWDGVTIEDDVFVGANVSFTNDTYPRSKHYDTTLLQTKVCKGASIGANAVILPGVTIGERAIVGAGSVVTKDIPSEEIWAGNPAVFLRKADK